MTQRNRPGYVFHCEAPDCEKRGLKLCIVTAADGSRTHRWFCEQHQDQPDVQRVRDVIG